MKISRAVTGFPPGTFHGSVTATGGTASRCAQAQRDRVRQGDVPLLAALGRGEHQPGAHHADLVADMHDPAQKVDVIECQPEHLPLAQTEPGWRGAPSV